MSPGYWSIGLGTSARRDGFAERRAEQRRQLHVAHAHPGWVDEHRDEEEERGAECCEHPLERVVGMERDLQDQHRGKTWQHDRVGHQPAVEVDRRQQDEGRSEDCADQGMTGQTEPNHATHRERRASAGYRELLPARERADVRLRGYSSVRLNGRPARLLHAAQFVAVAYEWRMSSAIVSRASHFSTSSSPVVGRGRSSSQTILTPTCGWSASIAAAVRAASLSDSLASRTTTSSRFFQTSSTESTILFVDSTAKPFRVKRNSASRRNSSSRVARRTRIGRVGEAPSVAAATGCEAPTTAPLTPRAAQVSRSPFFSPRRSASPAASSTTSRAPRQSEARKGLRF